MFHVFLCPFTGITQDQIDELREIVPNRMLHGMQEIYKNGGDLESRDIVGATPVSRMVPPGYLIKIVSQ